MTAWMLYLAAVSILLGAAARAAEAALALYGRPVRWVWAVALAGSLAVPVAFGLGPRPGVATAEPVGPDTANLLALALDRAPSPPPLLDRLRAPAALDRAVAIAWVASAGAGLLALAIWLGAVAVAPRRWPRGRLDGEDVRIAPHAGPAVFGLLRPSIVVPRWLLDCPLDVRRLALRHEREHVAARDPALLAAAATLVTATPWNPVSWWLLMRLRAAVELDCDRRVLRRGTNIHAYGAMLLGIAGRTTTPRLAVALVEPAVLLERRIRAMTGRTTGARGVRGALFGAAALAALLVACSLDGPTAPAATDDHEAAPVMESKEAPPSPEAAARYYEVLDRMGRVIALMRAELEGGTPGVATLDRVTERRRAPASEGTTEAETEAVVRRILEARVRALEAAVEAPPEAKRQIELREDALEALKLELDAGERIRRIELTPVLIEPALEALPRKVEAPAKAAARIRIRGNEKWPADRTPLMFVDGVPAKSLDDLDPDRIDSIEVLKGLAAQRLYGEAAKNGVIRVKTKGS